MLWYLLLCILLISGSLAQTNNPTDDHFLEEVINNPDLYRLYAANRARYGEKEEGSSTEKKTNREAIDNPDMYRLYFEKHFGRYEKKGGESADLGEKANVEVIDNPDMYRLYFEKHFGRYEKKGGESAGMGEKANVDTPGIQKGEPKSVKESRNTNLPGGTTETKSKLENGRFDGTLPGAPAVIVLNQIKGLLIEEQPAGRLEENPKLYLGSSSREPLPSTKMGLHKELKGGLREGSTVEQPKEDPKEEPKTGPTKEKPKLGLSKNGPLKVGPLKEGPKEGSKEKAIARTEEKPKEETIERAKEGSQEETIERAKEGSQKETIEGAKEGPEEVPNEGPRKGPKDQLTQRTSSIRDENAANKKRKQQQQKQRPETSSSEDSDQKVSEDSADVTTLQKRLKAYTDTTNNILIEMQKMKDNEIAKERRYEERKLKEDAQRTRNEASIFETILKTSELVKEMKKLRETQNRRIESITNFYKEELARQDAKHQAKIEQFDEEINVLKAKVQVLENQSQSKHNLSSNIEVGEQKLSELATEVHNQKDSLEKLSKEQGKLGETFTAHLKELSTRLAKWLENLSAEQAVREFQRDISLENKNATENLGAKQTSSETKAAIKPRRLVVNTDQLKATDSQHEQPFTMMTKQIHQEIGKLQKVQKDLEKHEQKMATIDDLTSKLNDLAGDLIRLKNGSNKLSGTDDNVNESTKLREVDNDIVQKLSALENSMKNMDHLIPEVENQREALQKLSQNQTLLSEKLTSHIKDLSARIANKLEISLAEQAMREFQKDISREIKKATENLGGKMSTSETKAAVKPRRLKVNAEPSNATESQHDLPFTMMTKLIHNEIGKLQKDLEKYEQKMATVDDLNSKVTDLAKDLITLKNVSNKLSRTDDDVKFLTQEIVKLEIESTKINEVKNVIVQKLPAFENSMKNMDHLIPEVENQREALQKLSQNQTLLSEKLSLHTKDVSARIANKLEISLAEQAMREFQKDISREIKKATENLGGKMSTSETKAAVKPRRLKVNAEPSNATESQHDLPFTMMTKLIHNEIGKLQKDLEKYEQKMATVDDLNSKVTDLAKDLITLKNVSNKLSRTDDDVKFLTQEIVKLEKESTKINEVKNVIVQKLPAFENSMKNMDHLIPEVENQREALQKLSQNQTLLSEKLSLHTKDVSARIANKLEISLAEQAMREFQKDISREIKKATENLGGKMSTSETKAAVKPRRLKVNAEPSNATESQHDLPFTMMTKLIHNEIGKLQKDLEKYEQKMATVDDLNSKVTDMAGDLITLKNVSDKLTRTNDDVKFLTQEVVKLENESTKINEVENDIVQKLSALENSMKNMNHLIPEVENQREALQKLSQNQTLLSEKLSLHTKDVSARIANKLEISLAEQAMREFQKDISREIKKATENLGGKMSTSETKAAVKPRRLKVNAEPSNATESLHDLPFTMMTKLIHNEIGKLQKDLEKYEQKMATVDDLNSKFNDMSGDLVRLKNESDKAQRLDQDVVSTLKFLTEEMLNLKTESSNIIKADDDLASKVKKLTDKSVALENDSKMFASADIDYAKKLSVLENSVRDLEKLSPELERQKKTVQELKSTLNSCTQELKDLSPKVDDQKELLHKLSKLQAELAKTFASHSMEISARIASKLEISLAEQAMREFQKDISREIKKATENLGGKMSTSETKAAVKPRRLKVNAEPSNATESLHDLPFTMMTKLIHNEIGKLQKDLEKYEQKMATVDDLNSKLNDMSGDLVRLKTDSSKIIQKDDDVATTVEIMNEEIRSLKNESTQITKRDVDLINKISVLEKSMKILEELRPEIVSQKEYLQKLAKKQAKLSEKVAANDFAKNISALEAAAKNWDSETVISIIEEQIIKIEHIKENVTEVIGRFGKELKQLDFKLGNELADVKNRSTLVLSDSNKCLQDITTLTEKVSSLNTTMSSLSSNMAKERTKNVAEVSTIKDEMATLAKQVTTTALKHMACVEERTKSDEDVPRLKDDVKALTTQMTSFSTTMSSLSNQVVVLEEKIKSAAEMPKVKDAMAALTTKVTIMDSAMSILSSKMNATVEMTKSAAEKPKVLVESRSSLLEEKFLNKPIRFEFKKNYTQPPDVSVAITGVGMDKGESPPLSYQIRYVREITPKAFIIRVNNGVNSKYGSYEWLQIHWLAIGY